MRSQVQVNTTCFIYYVFLISISSLLWRCTIVAYETCGRPARTQAMTHIPTKSSYEEGQEIIYSCRNKRDKIVGNAVRKCLRNGTWSGEMPVCSELAKIQEARFVEPRNPAILSIDKNISTCTRKSLINQTAWIGYLSNSSIIYAVRIVFQGNGRMNLKVSVEDKIQCQNFNLNTVNILTSTSLTFHCPNSTSGKNIIIKNSNSEKSLKICEVFVLISPVKQCLTPDIPLHSNVYRIVSGNRNGYRLSCHTGYKMWGELVVNCQSDGTWYPKSPICEKIYCLPPPPLKNGKVEYDLVNEKVPYNGTARYKCDSGYYLSGPLLIKCRRWRTWDAPMPECKLKTPEIITSPEESACDATPYIENGELKINSTNIGSVATLQCNEGFRPLTDDPIYCLPVGKWNFQNHSCTAIQCEDNPVIPHGVAILLNKSSYYGAYLQIKCSQSYSSPIIRKCEKSGSWGDLDICTGNTCGTFTGTKNKDDDWISLNYSQAIKVLVCPKGFHIEGSPPMSRCLSNGSWSYTSALCKRPLEVTDWGNIWTPSLILIAAVAVGAGTAISIICLFIALLDAKKRRRSRMKTTIFHLDNINNSNPERSEALNFPQKKYHSEIEEYEADIELRHKTSVTNPRKLHSALPNLPLEADPVYAQPFEAAAVTKRISIVNAIKKDELYNTHIYAEPVNSRLSTSSSTTMLINELYAKTETNTERTPKTSLQSEMPPVTKKHVPRQHSWDKQCIIYDSMNNSSNLNEGNLIASSKQCQEIDNSIILNSFTETSEYSV